MNILTKRKGDQGEFLFKRLPAAFAGRHNNLYNNTMKWSHIKCEQNKIKAGISRIYFFVLVFILLGAIGFGVYYYETLQIERDVYKQKNILLQQDVDMLIQKRREAARLRAIPVLSKDIPIVGSVRFENQEEKVVYQITEVTKYWLGDSSESKDISFSQMTSSGTMRNFDHNVPAGKSIIAVSVFLTNAGEKEVFPDTNLIRPIFTNPEIRAKSSEGQTQLINIPLLGIPPGKSYECKFLFYADYNADRTFIRYGAAGTDAEGGLLVDFNIE